MIISLEHVLTAVSYNSETGIFFRVKSGGRKKAGDVAGYCKTDGYRLISINGGWVYAHRLAWFLETGFWPKDEIDHINGNRDDNRIINLRQATRSQNMRNVRGSKGWHYHRTNNCWQALIRVEKKRVYLGRFDTEESAKRAYLDASIKYHGEFSKPTPKQDAFI